MVLGVAFAILSWHVSWVLDRVETMLGRESRVQVGYGAAHVIICILMVSALWHVVKVKLQLVVPGGRILSVRS